MESSPIHYFVFDLLYLNGYDLRKSPLLQRKELLRKILRTDERVRYSEHEIEKGKELYAAAQEKHLEGIIGKQVDSTYSGGRTYSWLKFKIVKELDAVIGGWTAPRGTRAHFGALLLGLYDGNELAYIGSVGTGFNQSNLKNLFEKLNAIRADESPFRSPPRLREKIEWVRPQLVARVKYGNWTDDMRLRVPVFLSLRLDGDPRLCTFEGEGLSAPDVGKKHIRSAALTPAPVEEPKTRGRSRAQPRRVAAAPANRAADDIEKEIRQGKSESLSITLDGKTVQLTHLDKIYFPKPGLRKRDLLAYYYRIAPLILPFLENRPLVLRRYPNGLRASRFSRRKRRKSIPNG
jgi:bifunctional non-homologous end joining protein LigD